MKIVFFVLFLVFISYKNCNSQEKTTPGVSSVDKLLSTENVLLKQKVKRIEKNNRLLKRKNTALSTQNRLLINKIFVLKKDSIDTHTDLNKSINEKNTLVNQYNINIHNLHTKVVQLEDSLKQYVNLESEIKNIRIVISGLNLAMRSYNLSQSMVVPKIKNFFIFNQSKYNLIDASVNKVWAQESIEQLIPRRLIGQKKLRTKVNYTLIFRIHPLDPNKTLMDIKVDFMRDNENDLEIQFNQIVKFQNRLLKNLDTLLSDYVY